MKRIISGIILILIITFIAVENIVMGDLPLQMILIFCGFWYSLFGYMIYTGYKSRQKHREL